jgi:hypothetical protein
MKERDDLINTLEQYANECAMSVDVGYHLRQLIQALQDETQEED